MRVTLSTVTEMRYVRALSFSRSLSSSPSIMLTFLFSLDSPPTALLASRFASRCHYLSIFKSN